MTKVAQGPFEMLGGLFRLANERRDLLEEVKSLLEEIETSGRLVAGERALLDGAKQLLADAVSKLETLTDAAAVEGLEAARSSLGMEEWELLADIREELGPACSIQREAVEGIRGLKDGIDIALRDAMRAIDEARLALAPTREALRTYQRVMKLRDETNADLSRAPGAVISRKAELEAARPELEATVASLRTSIDDARINLRHAELVLIYSQAEAAIQEYSVLLRTPAEPGAHGVHVRGTTSLVRQDRALVFEALDSVTESLPAAGALRRAGAAEPVPDVQPLVEAKPTQAVRGGLPPPPPLAESLNEERERRIADLGDLMFRLFLPEEMQLYLRQTPCAMTLTTNDLELPWELMRFDDTVLCLDRCIGRMPMGNTFPRPDPLRPFDNQRVRFLLVCADDEGKLQGAREEVDRIYKALMELQRARASDPSVSLPIDVEVLASPNVDGRTLNKKLRYERYNVIHFAGHAKFDPSKPELSALLLDRGEVFLAQKIRRLLIGRPLVFLNACDSARTRNEANETLATYLKGPAEGLAASFLYGGALGCIGSLWPVYDEPASDFAISFYRSILDGNVIGEAMRKARIEIRKKHPQHFTWATFVLYGNPTFRLQS